MCTWKDIQQANEAIRTTDIKGKEYAEVNQRVKAFRMVYPNGSIITNLVSNENGICIFNAIVGYSTENGGFVQLGTGTAYEKESSSFINKTSYIENCETSAVGRALGFAGFGIDTSIASADEVKNAMNNQKQEEPKKATKKAEVKPEPTMSSKQIDVLNALLGENKLDAMQIFGMEVIDMPARYFDRALQKIKEVIG